MTTPSVDPLLVAADAAEWHFIGAELVDAASQTVGVPGSPVTQSSQEAAAAAAGAVGQGLVSTCTGTDTALNTTSLSLMATGAAGVFIGISACVFVRWWLHATDAATIAPGPMPADASSVASQVAQADVGPMQEQTAQVQDTMSALPTSETEQMQDTMAALPTSEAEQMQHTMAALPTRETAQMKAFACQEKTLEQPLSAPLLTVQPPAAVYPRPVLRVLALECPQAPLSLPPPPAMPTLVVEQPPPRDPKPAEPPVAVSTSSTASAMVAGLRGASEGDRLGLACGVAFLGLAALASSAVLGHQLLRRAQAAEAAIKRVAPQVTVPLAPPHATPPLGLPSPPWAAVVTSQRLLPPPNNNKQPLLSWQGSPLQQQQQQQQPWSSSFAGPGAPSHQSVQQDMGHCSVDIGFGVLRKSLPRPARHRADTCVVDGIVRVQRPTSSRVFRILP